MGSPVNFTGDSLLVNNVMLYKTADIIARAGMKDVEYLLDSGVKVALVYGDRDYRCPWVGVENLAIKANWTGADEFRSSGYEYVHTNKSYDGGVVRQHGNLSFTRVFEAGHDG
jgi:carboxypeptidase D